MRSFVITVVFLALLSSNVPAFASPVDTTEKERNCHSNPKNGNICATPPRICGEGATGFPCTGGSKVPVSTMISTINTSATDSTSSTSASQTTVSRSIRRFMDEPRALRLPSTHPPAPIPTFTYKPTTSSTPVTSASTTTTSLSDTSRTTTTSSHSFPKSVEQALPTNPSLGN